MNKFCKYLVVGCLSLWLSAQAVFAQPQQADPTLASEALAAPAHQCCDMAKAANFVSVQSCYSPAAGIYAVIDSIDCAVDILRSTDNGLVRVGHFVTDDLFKRYDLVNILRPKSVQILHDHVVFLASAQNDSSYLGVLDFQGNLVARVDFGCANYAFTPDCANKQIIVMGKSPVGYDINFVSVQNGLTSPELLSGSAFHYHKPKQSERIAESDPWGIGVACVAIAVVFLALLCIFLIVKGYGNGIVSIQSKRAKKSGEKNVTAAPGDVYAAIAAAIYMMNEEQHDDEGGVITINKVERAWTPWNAKFYNMNQYFKTRR